MTSIFKTIKKFIKSIITRNLSTSGKDPDLMNKKYELANRVRALRKSYNLTQVELAEKFGVSQPYISEIERSYDLVSLPTYDRILKFLTNYNG